VPSLSLAYILLPVTDLARAKYFYGAILGLHASAEVPGDSIEFELPGISPSLLLMVRDGAGRHAKGGILGFDVEDLDSLLPRVAEGGGVIGKAVRLPAQAGRAITVFDPDGNVLELIERYAPVPLDHGGDDGRGNGPDRR
jgi:predicted enzyme related to lactoylglutathione lyase